MTDIFGPHVIELVSGGKLDLTKPDPDAIVLSDIAHALSYTCRFAGHTSRFYSVAEHAVLVAIRLADTGCSPATQLLGLHHDDSEAYLGDIPRPLKSLLGSRYRDLEINMQRAVYDALGLHPPTGEQALAIHEADNWALAAEAHSLMPSKGVGWFCDGLFDPGDRPESFDPPREIDSPRGWAVVFTALHGTLVREAGPVAA